MVYTFRTLLVGAAIALAVPAAVALTATPVQAQSFHSLRHASDEYRNAATALERHVHRAGHFDHYDKRLASRLRSVASEFRSAARNPGDLPRLLYRWNDLLAMHAQVERAIVVGCGRPDPELIRCWQRVGVALDCLVDEMRCFTGHHGSAHVSHRPVYDSFPAIPSGPGGRVHEDYWRGSSSGFDAWGGAPHMVDPRGVDPRFGLSRPPVSGPAAVQMRSAGVPAIGRHHAPVDPRREIGAVIAASLLNRLWN